MSSEMATYHLLSCFIQDGNLRGLTICLSSHHSQVDARDENGNTALMYTCLHGMLPFVKELIKHGADINAVDYDKWSPLLNAAKEGHIDVVAELLDCGAFLEHNDIGGWTALVWACYKGHTEVVKLLLDKGADSNVTGQYHVSGLVWAAGRGYKTIVRQLLNHGAKVNLGDKYGTTALVWACRKGYVDIVDELLKAGANVDTAGMYSWTPLLVATTGNYPEVVNLLLDYKPNVNALDSDGCTALTIACKDGSTDVAVALLNAGAYVNLQDRNCDTNLIHAAKAGHMEIVDALLKKYADIDVQGMDRKTALYWAVEKGNNDIVRAILHAGPDMELATKDGDTALMKATRNRNVDAVQVLLERKAKVSAADKKGDTALHIAMRSHSKTIVELLLRNPKNSQLLYRPNRNGETPYNIDSRHQRSILAQIFGARRLNTNEDNENMLGYDLYGSALADILSEPSLSMPICLGLYAKWGSGKSFLLGKLRDEMKNFARQWIEPTFEFSWVSLLVVFISSLTFGLFLSLLTHMWLVGFFGGVAIFTVTYIVLVIVKVGCDRYDWQYCYEISVYLARKVGSLRLFLQVVFCHPPQKVLPGDVANTQNIRFLFTDQTKVSGSAGDTNVAHMVSSLFTAIEHEYGTLTTRLYTVFKPKTVTSSSWKWRRLCCIPNFFIFLGLVFCVVCIVVIVGLFYTDYNVKDLLGSSSPDVSTIDNDNKSSDKDDDDDDDDDDDEDSITARRNLWFAARAVLVTIGCILAVAVVANIYTLVRMMSAICYPQKHRVVRMIGRSNGNRGGGGSGELKADGHLQRLRTCVQLMADLVKCLDGFTGNQTRLVIIVDGLDSCEQDKVLHNLDAVHLLFSDLGAPFIILLAIDPHVIIKAIEVNIHRVFHDSSISGHNYLRNIVHLPFYLQNAGLRRVRVAQRTASHASRKIHRGPDLDDAAASARRLSSESSMSIPERVKQLRGGSSTKGSKKLKPSDSIASSVGNVGRPGGAHDLTRVLLTDDYFSDVNPRSMRRLMNVMYITGRLLKAFNIDFNWYHLASWVNITEQWPYRTSWIIFYYEKNEESLDDTCSLKSIYDKIRDQIPMSRDVEPLLEIDRDERKFEVFLTFHKTSLHVLDLKVFLPFTINLDPYIRKTIREEQHNIEEMARIEGMPPISSMPRSWLQASSNVHRRPLVGKEAIAAPNWMYPYGTPMMMAASAPPVWSGPPISLPVPSAPTAALTASANNPVAVHSSEATSSALQRHVPTPLTGKTLDSLTVSGVCSLISALEGIDPGRLQHYKDTFMENNIHGRVLLSCDLDELKKVMHMSFGDWEVFRVALLALREQPLEELDALQSSVHFALTDTDVQAHDGVGHTVSADLAKTHSSYTGSAADSLAMGDLKPLKRERSSSLKSQSIGTLQKQVTLEDQMIVGALQSLNEQAEEDTRLRRLSGPPSDIMLSEEQMNSGNNSLGFYALPIATIDEMKSTADRNVIDNYDGGDGSSEEEKETEVFYLRSHLNSPLLQSPITDIDSRLSPHSIRHAVVNPVEGYWVNGPRRGSIIEMDHLVPEYAAAPPLSPSNSVTAVISSVPVSNEHNLPRLKRLLASVATPSSSPNRRHRVFGGIGLDSPGDSDPENSENAPLVANRFSATSTDSADQHHHHHELDHDDGNDLNSSSKSTILAIDAPTFRPFHTVPSCPEIRFMSAYKTSHSPLQTSPVSITPPVRGVWGESSSSNTTGHELLDMLGGSETVL